MTSDAETDRALEKDWDDLATSMPMRDDALPDDIPF